MASRLRRPRTGFHLAAQCRCGRLGCDGCPLTPRTVYLLGVELAWLADMAEADIADILLGRRSIARTVFGSLPELAAAWGSIHPVWLERYAGEAERYEARLSDGHAINPHSVAEEVLLHGAFEALRSEPDPDAALPPAGLVLPKLPGDYAWARAAEQVGFRSDLAVLYHPVSGPLIEEDDALHPSRWFEPYRPA